MLLLRGLPIHAAVRELMKKRFTLSETIASIEQAFLPLRCVVELFDNELQLRFRVFNMHDQRVFTASRALVDRARTPAGLSNMVLRSRTCVVRRGFQLHPWHSPS